MGLLSMIGAVSAEEHAKLDTKFKTAIKDLAARDDELDGAEKRIEGLLRDATARAKWNKDITDRLAKAEAELAALRPDAEWARARKAKAAAYEAAKRVRKPRKAAKQEAETLTTAIRDSIQKGARRPTARFRLNEKGLAASKKAVAK